MVVKHDHSEVVLIFVKTVSAGIFMYGVAVYVEELQTLYGWQPHIYYVV